MLHCLYVRVGADGNWQTSSIALKTPLFFQMAIFQIHVDRQSYDKYHRLEDVGVFDGEGVVRRIFSGFLVEWAREATPRL